MLLKPTKKQISVCRGTKGFTLVEIMIVVAIIALLAALAIPNLLRSRHNANEAVAIGTLKNISTACENFRAGQTVPTYPADSAALTGATPTYLDATLFAVGGHHGYIFTYTQLSNMQYMACGVPITYQVTGTRTFAVNETGLIRAIDNNGVAINTEAEYAAMTAVQ